MKSAVEFGVLGSVEVLREGRRVALGGSKQRALLAMLLLRANRTVSVEDLIDGLWGDEPPPSAHKMVQIYVHRLRTLLDREARAGARLHRVGAGYTLDLGPGDLDLERFEELTNRASAVAGGDPAAAADLFREALALFRGPVLSGVGSEPFAATEIARLEELRLSAVEAWINAELDAGRHDRCLGELRALVAQHPLRERFREQLMIALYREGRQAEALEVYRQTSEVLREELGVDPRPELVRLQRAILRHELAGVHPAAAPAAPPPPLARTTRRRLGIAAGAAIAVAVVAAATVAVAERSGTVAPRPNSVAVVDPSTGRLEASVPAGAVPGPIAATADSIWIGNLDDRTISRIDLRSEQASKTFGLAASPVSLTAAGGVVWIGNGYTGTLSRVLTAYDQLTGQFFPGRQVTGEVAVAATDRALWVGLGDGTLLSLDPASLRLESAVRLPNRARALALSSNAVWTIQFSDNFLRRVDQATGTVTSPVSLPSRPVLLLPAYGSLWVATAGDDRLWRVDPSAGRIVDSTPLGIDPEAITAGGGAVWVSGGTDGTVDVVDAHGGGLTRALKLGRRVGGIAFADGRLWATLD